MSERDCLLIRSAVLKRNTAIQLNAAETGGRNSKMASRFVFLLGHPRWNLHPRQNSFDATGQALRLRRPVRTYFWLSR